MMRMKEKNINPYFVEPFDTEYSPMFSDDFVDNLAHILLKE